MSYKKRNNIRKLILYTSRGTQKSVSNKLCSNIENIEYNKLVKSEGCDILAIKIFIDQGHNPSYYHNSGAIGNNLFEQDITYQVGIYLANLLKNNPQFEARVSRATPKTVLGTSNITSLQERVQMANQWPADYFISIHCNANPNPNINGTEVYIYKYNSEANWLAEQVMDGITETVGTKNNGIRVNSALYVLRKTQMPAILVELGYLTNINDAKKLGSNPYGFAYGMYLGILRYFDFV